MSLKIVRSSDVSLTPEDRFQLFEIMRIAYATTEIEVWGEDYIRMSQSEYEQLIDEGNVLVAYWAKDICGCVSFSRKSENAFRFSLLGTRQGFTKRGIGKALVEATEQIARDSGAKFMELEILRPVDSEPLPKELLRKWYIRMGYSYTSSQDFAEVYTEKAKNLITPSNFDYYRKAL